MCLAYTLFTSTDVHNFIYTYIILSSDENHSFVMYQWIIRVIIMLYNVGLQNNKLKKKKNK